MVGIDLMYVKQIILDGICLLGKFAYNVLWLCCRAGLLTTKVNLKDER
jgi:hypothetical protein